MQTINERFRLVREILDLSQEDFATKALRTRSEIKNIEYNKTTPKEEVIRSVCSAHKINEAWLRTGAGEPFCKMTVQEELSDIFANVLNGDPSTKSRLIRAFARLPEEAYPLVEDIVKKMAAELENEKAE